MGSPYLWVKDFYCKQCGSMTAIIIVNLNKIRCLGCDQFYEKGDKWVEIERPMIRGGN